MEMLDLSADGHLIHRPTSGGATRARSSAMLNLQTIAGRAAGVVPLGTLGAVVSLCPL